jgi:hypothetical protein
MIIQEEVTIRSKDIIRKADKISHTSGVDEAPETLQGNGPQTYRIIKFCWVFLDPFCEISEQLLWQP